MSTSSPSTSSSSTPWGERQRHQQIDEATKGEWIAVQKKAFTRWANSHLKRRGLEEINDLFTDTSDGIRLLHLLEVIGGDSIYSLCKRKYNPAPKFRIHKLENCNLIFEYLQKKDLKLTNIGSTDIVDTNEKLILGLMWTIILRFAIAEDGKQGLLLWLQRSLTPYQPHIHIHNFDLSWQDGKAFLALIHRYRPDVCVYEKEATGDARANVTRAFQLAKEELGIENLLDPEDVVDTAKPDEKAMVAYLSQFFSKFAGLARKQALIESIVKAIAVSRKHDALIERYLCVSGGLKQWLEAKRGVWEMGEAQVGTTAEVKEKLDALSAYRREEKVHKKALLLEVTTLLGQLRTSQRSNNRPIFTPPPGLSDKELWEGAWPALEKAEAVYEKSLIEKYGRFTVIDFSLTKIRNKLGKLEPWLTSRTTYFTHTHTHEIKTISEVEQRLSSHEAFLGQVDIYHALLTECQRLLANTHTHTHTTTLSEEHTEVAPTKARVEKCVCVYDALLTLASTFRKEVEARLVLEKELEAAALKYSSLAQKCVCVCDECEEAIAEPILGNSVEEVQALKERFACVCVNFAKIDGDMQELQKVVEMLNTHGRAESIQRERQTVAPSVLIDTHTRIASELKTRTQALEEAERETAHKVETRQAFAQAAKELDTYIQEISERSTLGGRRASLKPEEVTAELRKVMEDYQTVGKEEKLAEVEKASTAQEAAGVVANGFTTDTIYSLRKSFEELGKLLNARLEDHLSAEAAFHTQTAESDEQWKEITKVFHCLDVDRTGTLSGKEFKEGLQALGVLLDDSEADQTFKKLCKTKPAQLSLAEFGTYVCGALTAGSSSEDVLTAFKTITGGEKLISEDVIEELFVGVGVCVSETQKNEGESEDKNGGGGGGGDLATYMLTHMEKKGTKVVKVRLAATPGRGGEGEENGGGGGGENGDVGVGVGVCVSPSSLGSPRGEEVEREVDAYDYVGFVNDIFGR